MSAMNRAFGGALEPGGVGQDAAKTIEINER